MKDRKKRKQREEVRKILHTMRLELAAQRLTQTGRHDQAEPPLSLAGLLKSSGVQARTRNG